ncbi:N-6 DNA methylase, partial [Cylindrospermopsis raciborskii CS-506_D]|nr:N-6 DNA methylase [Cylindrospermopsis raciborskii CS-506_D]
QNAPPKWVILINMEQIVLIDRYKWNASRLIRFDLAKLLEERDKKSLMVTAKLLHRESIVPKDGTCLLDIIDEKSYRHSYSISENLKFALREAIEILGNEAIYYWQKSGKRVFDNQKQKEQGVVEIDPQQLKKECLRWIYRLLFLFYIEARPELGYIPMGSDVYRQGYSLEALRDVELAKLTEEDEENYYLDWSIRLLFELLWSGYPLDKQKQLTTENPSLADTLIHKTFRLPSLQSHLFDPKNTKMLNEVKFRNVALQKIIRLMSLSTEEGKRGRISYAQLGVNQLGEVYEGLLSLSAFLAQEDLYEVQPSNKKESGDESEEQEEEDLETNERENVTRGKTVKAKENLKQDLEVAYFIPEHRMDEFKQEELVIDWEKGEFRKHAKGKFLFRLAGRDREKSASYYTPQSLTKCLVKYALKELLEGKQADDILELTICEPAMGSAAFLNEVIDQLAETYLERKQKEKGELISHEQVMREQQKIKMLLADRNVFGIDKNPIAMELAEVSLWLNCIYASEADKDNIFIPWFGFQLQCGNSLIGARRQIYYLNNITEKKKSKSSKNTKWYEQEPEQLSLGKNLPKGGIFHFLLGDSGMSDYTDKIIKKMSGENLKKIDNWRKEFCQELTDEQGSYAHTLSERIDKLWHHYAQELKRIRKRTTDSLNIWGQEEEKKQEIALEKKDKIHDQEKLAEGIENATSYRRLKLVMDYWCALWFWPIEKAEELPDREQFFCDLAIILGETEMLLDSNRQLSLFPETQTPHEGEEFINKWGFVNLNKLKQKNIRLQIVDEVVNNQRFFH